MKNLKRNRVIPVLLLKDGGLVKTYRFANEKYVGDPLNAIKIFNEKSCDELVLFDIENSNDSEIEFELIEKIAKQCRMPLTYGGNISSIKSIERLISSGVERVTFSSSLLSNTTLIKEAIDIVGAQSVVIVLDYKIENNLFSKARKVYFDNGTRSAGYNLEEAFSVFDEIGVGEIFLQNIDNDGGRKGLDRDVITNFYGKYKTPFTICGGLSNIKEIKSISDDFESVGIAGGAYFVFTGKFDSVLISYMD